VIFGETLRPYAWMILDVGVVSHTAEQVDRARRERQLLRNKGGEKMMRCQREAELGRHAGLGRLLWRCAHRGLELTWKRGGEIPVQRGEAAGAVLRWGRRYCE
jgi:hypothetical protein